MAEKKVIELEVQDNLKSFKQQLREAQAEVTALSEKFGATSAEAINAAKRAGELKDKIGDAKALTDAFNPDAKFKALSSSIGGAVSGFGAFQGALGLVGAESQDVEKMLLKVQSAMALSQGLQGLGEARDSFKQLGAVAMDTFKGIKGALLATGIGLFVVAVGLLADNWDEVRKAVGLYNPVQEALNSTMADYSKGVKDAVTKTNEVKVAFDLAKKGVMSKKEALKIYNDTLGDAFGKTNDLNKAEKLYNEKAKDFIKATGLRAQALALGNKIAELSAEKATAQLQDQLTLTEKAEVELARSIGGAVGAEIVRRKLQAEGVARRKKEIQEEIDILNKLQEKQLTQAMQLEKDSQIKSDNQIKIDEEEKKRADEKAKKDKEARDKRLAEEQAYQESLAKMKKDAENSDQEAIDAYMAEKKAKDDARMAKERADYLEQLQFKADIEEAERLKQEQLDKEAEERKRQRKQATKDFTVSMTKQGLQLASDLVDLFAKKDEESARKAFKIKKAIGIANATISAVEGVQNAFTTASSSPITAVFPAYPFIQAGLAGAFGAVQIATIAKSQYNGGATSLNTGGSGGSGGSSTGANVSTPNFNIVGNGTANPLEGLPSKVYVVSGDVTSSQALERNAIKTATFG